MVKRIISSCLAAIIFLLPLSGFAQDDTTEQLQALLEPQHQNGVFSFENSEVAAVEGDGVRTTLTVLRKSGLADRAEINLIISDINATYDEDYVLYYNGEKIEVIDGAFALYDLMNESISADLPIDKFMETPKSETHAPDSLLGLKNAVTQNPVQNKTQEFVPRSAEVPLIFEDGQDNAELELEILDDDIREFDESFSMTLREPSIGILGENATLNVTIRDNEEAPEVFISFARAEADSGEDVKLIRTGNVESLSVVTVYEDGEPLGKVSFAPYQSEQTIDADGGVLTLGDFSEAAAGDIDTMVINESKTQRLSLLSSDSTEVNISVENDGKYTYLDADDFETGETHYSWFEKRLSDTIPYWYTDSYDGRYKHRAYATIGTRDTFPSLLYASASMSVFTKSTNDSNYAGLVFASSNTSAKNENAYVYNEATVESLEGTEYATPIIIPLTKDSKLYNGYFKVYFRHQGSGWGSEFQFWNARLQKREFNITVLSPNELTYEGTGEALAPAVVTGSFTGKVPDKDKDSIVIGLDKSRPYGFKITGYEIYKKVNTDKYEPTGLSFPSQNGEVEFTSEWVLKAGSNLGWVDIYGQAPTFYIKPKIEKVAVNVSIASGAALHGTVALAGGEETHYTGDTVYFDTITPDEGYTLKGIRLQAYKESVSSTAVMDIMLNDSTGDRPYAYMLGTNPTVGTQYCEKYVFTPIFEKKPNEITITVSGDKSGEVSEGTVVDAASLVVGDIYPLNATPATRIRNRLVDESRRVLR